MQIIGGYFGAREHYICLYYDTKNLHFYDSLGQTSFNNVHALDKRYIQTRYPEQVIDNRVIEHKVTQQKDGFSCGVFSCINLITIALGFQPEDFEYDANNPNLLRNHLRNTILTKTLSLFPYDAYNIST